MMRIIGLTTSILTLAAIWGPAQGQACTPGEEACPVVLKMAPGARSIEATGFVSGEHPDFYFKFDAKAGQKLIIHTEGGGLKTGPGIPITGPNGTQDAVDEDSPYTLPASGDYVIQMHANTMSEGPFGRFRLTLIID
jgi:hypothetical protein